MRIFTSVFLGNSNATQFNDSASVFSSSIFANGCFNSSKMVLPCLFSTVLNPPLLFLAFFNCSISSVVVFPVQFIPVIFCLFHFYQAIPINYVCSILILHAFINLTFRQIIITYSLIPTIYQGLYRYSCFLY